MDINTQHTSEFLHQMETMVTKFGIDLAAAILILLCGVWLIKWGRQTVDRLLRSRKLDLTLVNFISSFLYAAGIILVVMAAMNQLGVQMSSFLAILASAGLAIGLALQGSLSNMAGGVLLIALRPIRVGDYIEFAGVGGVVRAVDLFSTTLTAPDNKIIHIPNGKLVGDTIINHSTNAQRRVDLTFSVVYKDNMAQVKETIFKVLHEDRRILETPAPVIGIISWSDDKANIVVRPWVDASNYWDTYFELNERIKSALTRLTV